MGTSVPAQPDAPDYAEANKEGIYADIDTLPIRRQIEQAAALGQKIDYVDQNGNAKTADFTGLGDINLAKQSAALASETNADVQRQQLKLRQELGEANAAQTAKEVRAADPLAYDARQSLTKKVLGDLDSPTDQVQTSTALKDLASQAATASDTANQGLGSIYDRVTRLDNGNLSALASEANSRLTGKVNDPSTSALNLGLQKAVDEYNLGGKLDADTQSQIEQQARASMAARGNILGNAATFTEAMNVGQAAEARKAQRLQQLLDVQGKAFDQNSSLRNEERTAETQRLGVLQGLDSASYDRTMSQQQVLAGLEQQQYQNKMSGLGTEAQLTTGQQAEERATRSENYGKQQQKLSNASSFVLGQPITNQFGSLGAAQQGAVAYNPVNYQTGTTINANAGQAAVSSANNQFSTLANMWQTQANIAQQDNAQKWSMISSGAGMAAGALM